MLMTRRSCCFCLYLSLGCSRKTWGSLRIFLCNYNFIFRWLSSQVSINSLEVGLLLLESFGTTWVASTFTAFWPFVFVVASAHLNSLMPMCLRLLIWLCCQRLSFYLMVVKEDVRGKNMFLGLNSTIFVGSFATVWSKLFRVLTREGRYLALVRRYHLRHIRQQV